MGDSSVAIRPRQKCIKSTAWRKSFTHPWSCCATLSSASLSPTETLLSFFPLRGHTYLQPATLFGFSQHSGRHCSIISLLPRRRFQRSQTSAEKGERHRQTDRPRQTDIAKQRQAERRDSQEIQSRKENRERRIVDKGGTNWEERNERRRTRGLGGEKKKTSTRATALPPGSYPFHSCVARVCAIAEMLR